MNLDNKDLRKAGLIVVGIPNAWVVNVLENYTNAEWDEVIDSLHSYKKTGVCSIFFEDYDDTLIAELKEFELKIRPFRIQNSIFNLEKIKLSKLISDFILKTYNSGLIGLDNGIVGLIPKNTINLCQKQMRINIKKKDDLILEKYEPEIIRARKLFESQALVKNIDEIVKKVYLSESKRLVDSFFDFEGKRLSKLTFEFEFADFHKFRFNGTTLMIAIGAFGYWDFRGTLFLASQRIIRDRIGRDSAEIVNHAFEYKWKIIDRYLCDAIRNKYGLIQLISRLANSGNFNKLNLIDVVPIMELIPGGLHLLGGLHEEKQKEFIEKYYPNLDYTLVN